MGEYFATEEPEEDGAHPFVTLNEARLERESATFNSEHVAYTQGLTL